MNDWLSMTAGDLGRGIATGEIDPVALTETYLEAIATHPHRDRIYARVTADRARAEARAAADRARRGLRLSPLDGVPVSWKDLFDSAGVATESGSALLRDRVPDRDARVLADATAMGLVCLGKTHMSELAFSGIGLNPVTATPPNVNDPAAVPGGSSSGAAASVAFGLAAIGIGSDTGGSVRIPAVWNDLVGLKTSWGRLSLDGVVPLIYRLDTIGPLCRSVEDAALALAALDGGRPADLRGARLQGRRLAALGGHVMEGVEDAPLGAYRDACARLEDAGATIVPIEAPEAEEADTFAPIVFSSEAYGTWKDQIEADPDAMFGEILLRFRSGQSHAASDFVAAWSRLKVLRRQWLARTAGFDAVILPTAPILPPEAARMLDDHDYYLARNVMALRNTRLGNLLGSCGLTLPTGTPSCGLMMMGPPGGEAALLRLGAAAEKALA